MADGTTGRGSEMMQTDRYPISTLDLEGIPVWFTVGDRELLGFIKFTRSGRPVYRVGTFRKSDDLPSHARPALWRPVDPNVWPEPLPEPATVQIAVEWGKPIPPPRHSEPSVRDMDRWPYPHIDLGRAGSVPKSVEEAEARTLRALRCVDVIYRDEPERSETAWPRDLMVSAAMLKKLLSSSRTGKLPWLRDEDYRDVHVDVSDLSPRPARWVPTRRDLSDVEAGCLAWMNALSKKDRRLFRWRSDLPQWSFQQIAEMTRQDEDDVFKAYKAACVRLFAESLRATDL